MDGQLEKAETAVGGGSTRPTAVLATARAARNYSSPGVVVPALVEGSMTPAGAPIELGPG